MARIASETNFANGKYDQRGLHNDQADFGELTSIQSSNTANHWREMSCGLDDTKSLIMRDFCLIRSGDRETRNPLG